jgi:two-component system, OmpR family, response regulator
MAESLKVLVVESARLRFIINKVLTRDAKLRQFNIDVIEANDGNEGLQAFKDHDPDLIIQELLLSRMSGFELVRAIRKLPEGKTVPILVTTALTQDMTTLNLLHRHFSVHHQPKPFTPWDFALKVQQLIKLHVKGERKKSDSRPERPTGPLKSAPTLTGAELVEGGEKTSMDAGEIEVESAAKSSPRRPKRPSARFAKGSLSTTGLPSLILDALEEKLSGTITIKQGKMAKVIFFYKGYPVFAQSNLRRETLGQMLVRMGKISAEDNQRAMSLAKSRSIHFGSALQTLKLMDQETFGKELLTNVREKIETALVWRQGTWLFQEDPQVASKVPRCGIDPVKLVLRGLKKLVMVEESVQRVSGKENQRFSLLPRFENYRDAFVTIYGSMLVDVVTEGRTLNEMLMAMGSNPWDAIQQVDILLHANMAALHESTDELKEELEQSGDFTAQMTFRPDAKAT